MSEEISKKHYQEKINTISKIIKDKYDKNLDTIHMNTLYKEIKNAYYKEKPYSLSKKMYASSALIAYYKNKNKNTKILTNMIFNFQKNINIEEKKQKQTEKEKNNYIDYNEIKKKAEEYKNYETKEDMYNYLVLALISSDQGVLRPNIYANLKLVNNKTIDTNNKKENYIDLDTGIMYINKDKNLTKIKNTKNKIINKELKLHPEFLDIVKQSYAKFNREYLFDFEIKTKRIKILKILQSLTGKKFTFSMARSSYINNIKNNNPDFPYERRDELAYEMNHTIETQMKHYEKLHPVLNKITTVKKTYNNVDPYHMYKRAISMIKYANKHNTQIKQEYINNYQIIKENNIYKTLLSIPPKSSVKTNEFAKKLITNANKTGRKIRDQTMEKYHIKFVNREYKLS